MIRASTLAFSSVLFLASAALVAAPFAGSDLTTMPPLAADVEAQAAKIDLAEAIAAAQKETGGVASSAQMVFSGKETNAIEVIVYASGKSKRVMVDGTSGAITATMDGPGFAGDPIAGAIVDSPSGLKYYDIRPGTGEKPTPDAKVKVHYTGWLLNGKKFDSSYDRNAPAEFPLKGVIPGWTEGVGSMQVGGKRKLIIPSKLGYGSRGAPGGAVPPDAVLVFDVELLEIVK